jgi:hypothetical protein
VGSLAVDQNIAIRTRVVLPTHAIAKGLGFSRLTVLSWQRRGTAAGGRPNLRRIAIVHFPRRAITKDEVCRLLPSRNSSHSQESDWIHCRLPGELELLLSGLMLACAFPLYIDCCLALAHAPLGFIAVRRILSGPGHCPR